MGKSAVCVRGPISRSPSTPNNSFPILLPFTTPRRLSLSLSMVEQLVTKLALAVEDVASLPTADAKQRKLLLTFPLLDILAEILSIPLKINDMRTLRTAVANHIQQYELQADKELMRIVTHRFSFGYLPAISASNLIAYVQQLEKAGYGPLLTSKLPALMDKVSAELESVNNQRRSFRGPSSPSLRPMGQQEHLMLDRSSPLPSNHIKYYLCSLRRYQSTLWTSYRLYLDGVKELTSTGDCVNVQMLDSPAMLLGAKRLKSGISAQCFVWKTEDSKLWKEKNAIGKITRSSHVYLGIPFQSTSVSSTTAAPLSLTGTSNGDALNGEVSGESSVPKPGSASSSVDGQSNSVASSTSTPPSLVHPFNANHSTLAINPATTAGHTVADVSHTPMSPKLGTELLTQDLLGGAGPVAVAVQIRGLEKMISITVALQPTLGARLSSSSDANSRSIQGGVVSDGNGGSILHPSTVLQELENIVRNPAAYATALSTYSQTISSLSTQHQSSTGASAPIDVTSSTNTNGKGSNNSFTTRPPLACLVLRSKLPRKLHGLIHENGSAGSQNRMHSPHNANGNPSGGNGGRQAAHDEQYGVSFGRDSRIRAASRKNVAVDIWINSSGGDRDSAAKQETQQIKDTSSTNGSGSDSTMSPTTAAEEVSSVELNPALGTASHVDASSSATVHKISSSANVGSKRIEVKTEWAAASDTSNVPPLLQVYFSFLNSRCLRFTPHVSFDYSLASAAGGQNGGGQIRSGFPYPESFPGLRYRSSHLRPVNLGCGSTNYSTLGEFSGASILA